MAERIQRKRTKGWKMPPNTVSVTRPGPFGNPFLARDAAEAGYGDGREMAVHAYRRWLAGDKDWQPENRMFPSREYVLKLIPTLRGKNLACFCSVGPCHADVLLELANSAPVPSHSRQRPDEA